MPTVVIGTAGHIDHGKTTLLRALTGIDADRLPEEQARGMTIDVGFAHLDLDDGTSLDFVDVPGHDRLVGNMLVGAGEIDAVLLVVAADDGPRAQTLEHLELLDALGLTHAVVAITKADVASPDRRAKVAAEVRSLVDRTGLAGAPALEVSSTTGSGIAELRRALVAMRDAVLGDRAGRPGGTGPLRLPIDRAFSVKGRGLVVTGTLRGGSLAPGAVLRVVPGSGEARVRGLQVRHGPAELADGGRTAVNLAGVPGAAADLRRGVVLTAGPEIVATDRVLVVLRHPTPLRAEAPRVWPAPSSASLRLHLWTATVDAAIRPAGGRVVPLPDGRVVATLALAAPIAAMAGVTGVLRDPGSSRTVAGVTILDIAPPRGVSRRRMTPERLGALAAAVSSAPAHDADAHAALIDLHGAYQAGGPLRLAPDVEAALVAAAVAAVAEVKAGSDATIAEVRGRLLRGLRRIASVNRAAEPAAVAAIDAVIERLVASGRLRRDGDRLRPATAGGEAGPTGPDPRAAAMDRLEAALDVDVPPDLGEAARAAGATPEQVVALERATRIVRVEDDLAWASARYAALRDRAVAMARREPLTPAAFRDAIGGNRRVVMPLLEDFDRKGALRRTPAGHVPGPRA